MHYLCEAGTVYYPYSADKGQKTELEKLVQGHATCNKRHSWALNPGCLGPGSLSFLSYAGAPRLAGRQGGDTSRIPSRERSWGTRGMVSARRQDAGTRPAGRSKIPLLHKPGSMLLQPLPTPRVPDSGLWTAVHLLCGGNGKLGKYDICTKCCWAAGASSGHCPPLPGAQSLPGSQVRPRGLWEYPAACPGTRACLEEGEGLLF